MVKIGKMYFLVEKDTESQGYLRQNIKIDSQKTFLIKNSGNLSMILNKIKIFKGSWDPSHFIFENNVGKSRIRHRTTLNLNEVNPFSELLYVGADSFRYWFQK